MINPEIKQARVRLGMSQQQFATMLGVGMMTVSRWERGITSPSPLALEKLHKLIESKPIPKDEQWIYDNPDILHQLDGKP